MYTLLSTALQPEPNVIVKGIAVFLGWILNFIYDIVYVLSANLAFGLSVILFTVVVRLLMLPLAIKQQKSMASMQKLQPEMQKLQKKYGNSNDPENKRKLAAETQALYSKAGVNPLSGCLPLIIQFPIFMALSYIMHQSYLFVDKMGFIYRELGLLVMSVTPDWVAPLRPFAEAMVAAGKKFDIGVFDNLQKLLYNFTEADWAAYISSVPAELGAQMQGYVSQIEASKNLTYFLGINLLVKPSLTSVSIMIPVLCVVTTFLSSWFLNKASITTDSNAKMQQRVMLFMMPIMMGYFTFTFPAGVGLYWLSSTVFQIVQQIVLNKRYLPAKQE